MEYETVIGLEVHAQLLTRSKMYCRCSSDYASAPPNTHVCPVCLGMPGVLPTINRKAIEYTVMTALALNCTIAGYSKFDRKNYSYPDLMKGYQISQYDAPLGLKGWLTIAVNGTTKKVGITRVHLEEDVAKLIHTSSGAETYSLVDVNRSGVPLMEIVGEPDLRSPEEAREYLVKLRDILQYLGVSTGNMEEGSFRCDANISIRPKNDSRLLHKVEVKNMNSFRAVYRAMEYEAVRQRKVAEEGTRLVQETRGWVEEKGQTVSQRSKEYAHDYRYFPEPDLPPLALNQQLVEEIRSKLPELPDARRERFMQEYGLPLYDASLLTSSRGLADYYEDGVKASARQNQNAGTKELSNWVVGEVLRIINANNMAVSDFRLRVSPEQLSQLISESHGTVNVPTAKSVLEEMFRIGKSAAEIIKQKGLAQISDTDELKKVVSQVIQANAPAVADYRSGKKTALSFLTGQVMKATRGRANPRLVNEVLSKMLEGN